MGRPRKAAKLKQDCAVMVRLTRKEKRILVEAARLASMPEAIFVRVKALECARKIVAHGED